MCQNKIEKTLLFLKIVGIRSRQTSYMEIYRNSKIANGQGAGGRSLCSLQNIIKKELIFSSLMVRETGLEPACCHQHTDLNRARLPIPPFPLKVVDGGGFEPPKSATADLQSAPFGHSGTHP